MLSIYHSNLCLTYSGWQLNTSSKEVHILRDFQKYRISYFKEAFQKNKISGVWNEFQAILIHFRSIYSIFFGWVSPKKKVSKIVNTFCHRGGSSDPVPNQGGVRLIKKKSSTNVPEGGWYYIFVIFNCFFLFLTQKCAL